MVERTYKIKTLHTQGQQVFVFEMPLTAPLLRFRVDTNRFMLAVQDNQFSLTILDDGSTMAIRTFLLGNVGMEFKEKEILTPVGIVEGFFIFELGKGKIIKPKEEIK